MSTALYPLTLPSSAHRGWLVTTAPSSKTGAALETRLLSVISWQLIKKFLSNNF